MDLTQPQRRPTALAKRNGIPISPSLSSYSRFVRGQRVYVENCGTSTIRVVLEQSTKQNAFPVDLAVDHYLTIGEKRMADLGFPPGTIVAFSSSGADGQEVTIERIEREQDSDFVSPITNAEGIPSPPGWLVQQFTGVPNVNSFMVGGRRSAELIAAWAAEAGTPITSSSRVLDFGCGCGRIVSSVHNLYRPAAIWGSDLQIDAIDWLNMNMPFGTYIHSTENPPASVADSYFDVIYAVSVLTHLDKHHQEAWLREWRRILKPGGVAVVTFNGNDFVEKHLPKESAYVQKIEEFWRLNDGVAFINDKGWEGVFPDFYQTTYNTYDHIRKYWSEVFDIVSIKKSGAFANRQDTAVLRVK